MPFLEMFFKQPFEIIPIYIGHVFTEGGQNSDDDSINDEVISYYLVIRQERPRK